MSGKDDNIDDELMVRAAKLETSIAPERDLWPEIEQVITGPIVPKRAIWDSVWAQAAAVVLLVGGSSFVTYLTMNDNNVTTVPGVAESPTLVFEPVSGSFGSQYNLGPDYQDARRVLTGNLETQLAVLSPEAREDVLKNIETIRQAIVEINKALAEDPDNVLLQELLLDTYRDELAILKKVDGISNAAMYRNDI